MTADNPISGETDPAAAERDEMPILAARLTPHRSLGPRGFATLMIVFGGISFLAGIAFVRIGAWPVLGFFGLDVLILWLAMRSNFRAARMSEDVTVTADALTIRRVGPAGDISQVTLNPAWLRIETTEDPEDGMLRLAVRSHGRSHVIGGFLDPDSRKSFASALTAAVGAAKRR